MHCSEGGVDGDSNTYSSHPSIVHGSCAVFELGLFYACIASIFFEAVYSTKIEIALHNLGPWT